MERRKFIVALGGMAGLSLVSSAAAFSVVKYAGAAYLVYLGIRKLLEREEEQEVELGRDALRRAFMRGVVVNVLTYVRVPPFTLLGRPSDWTESNIYTLSPASKNLLASLDRPVKVYVLLPEGLLKREVETLLQRWREPPRVE